MNLLINIIKNDLKLIFRDNSLMIIFIVPVAIILICRFGITKLPEIVPDIHDYYWLIVAGLTMINAATPSYLFSFILLDERDENIDVMLRILPVPQNFILKSRIFVASVFGFIFSALILSLNGLILLNFPQILFLAILFSLISPASTFAITAFSKNKIEAASLFKAMNIILFIPIIAFFIDNSLKYVFGIIPFFWIYETARLANQNSQFTVPILTAFISNGFICWYLYKIYKKKKT
ncbi:MAG: hypothetical protein JXR61_08605 [Prolixibacteraceae bacterium]|nr:hypothetical protein [Prolixibacteraceae bacterium]